MCWDRGGSRGLFAVPAAPGPQNATNTTFFIPSESSRESSLKGGDGEKAGAIQQEYIQQRFFHPSELCCNSSDIWHFVWNNCWLATILGWKAGGRISLTDSGMSGLHLLLYSFAFPCGHIAELTRIVCYCCHHPRRKTTPSSEHSFTAKHLPACKHHPSTPGAYHSFSSAPIL